MLILGFFLIYFIEEIVHYLCDSELHGHDDNEVVEEVVSSEGGTTLMTDCSNVDLVSPDRLLAPCDWSSFEELETRWIFRRCFVRSPRK